MKTFFKPLVAIFALAFAANLIAQTEIPENRNKWAGAGLHDHRVEHPEPADRERVDTLVPPVPHNFVVHPEKQWRRLADFRARRAAADHPGW